MTQPLLLLITKPPTHELSKLAIRFAQAKLTETLAEASTEKLSEKPAEKLAEKLPSLQDEQPFSVFFYADGASTANQLSWQSAEQINMTEQWQQLAQQYELDLPVCVSTALARGVTDEANAKRHELKVANLAEGFRLVGLSELVMKMASHKVIQF